MWRGTATAGKVKLHNHIYIYLFIYLFSAKWWHRWGALFIHKTYCKSKLCMLISQRGVRGSRSSSPLQSLFNSGINLIPFNDEVPGTCNVEWDRGPENGWGWGRQAAAAQLRVNKLSIKATWEVYFHCKSKLLAERREKNQAVLRPTPIKHFQTEFHCSTHTQKNVFWDRKWKLVSGWTLLLRP